MRIVRWFVLPALACLFASANAQAGPMLTVDSFTTVTSTITQVGTGTTTSAGVSGAGILGTRTISITVATPLTSATGSAGLSPGLAEGAFNGNYSTPNLGSNYTLTEAFASTNAIAGGLNALSFVLGSSLGTTVTITANGTSTFTFTDPSSPPGINHTIFFSSFSDPTVFTALTSLTFVETFPNPGLSGPSVAFSGPILLAGPLPPVPEPSSIVMLAIAGLASGAFGVGRRFVRRNQVAA